MFYDSFLYIDVADPTISYNILQYPTISYNILQSNNQKS